MASPAEARPVCPCCQASAVYLNTLLQCRHVERLGACAPSVVFCFCFFFFLIVTSLSIALKRLRDSANANDVETGECAQWACGLMGREKAKRVPGRPPAPLTPLEFLLDSEVTVQNGSKVLPHRAPLLPGVVVLITLCAS